MNILKAILFPFAWIARRFGALLKSEAMKWCSEHKDLAVKIVLEIAGAALSGPEKRRAAFDRIKSALSMEGGEAADHFVNLLIEIVVTELKSLGRIP